MLSLYLSVSVCSFSAVHDLLKNASLKFAAYSDYADRRALKVSQRRIYYKILQHFVSKLYIFFASFGEFDFISQ